MLEVLTPRQRQVCDLIIQGKTNKQIGRVLGLSHRTIEVYKAGLLRALGVENTIQMIVKVMGELR